MLFYQVAKNIVSHEELIAEELFTLSELKKKGYKAGDRNWANYQIFKPVWIYEDDKRSIYRKSGHRFADDKVIYQECAYYTICNTGGIVLFDVNEDNVVSGFSIMDDPIRQVRENKVFWTAIDKNGESRPFFVKGGYRIYLDECMAVSL